MIRGAKKEIEAIPEMERRDELTVNDLLAWFEEDAVSHMLDCDLKWFHTHVMDSKRHGIEYPLEILQRRGADALKKTPNVIVGTIHCSPGDEKVLTVSGYISMENLDEKNPEHRLVTYCKPTNAIRRGRIWNRKEATTRRDTYGYEFTKEARDFSGGLITLRTETSVTRVTGNHNILIRFNTRARTASLVYLMRKGNWWRVGVTKFYTSSKGCGLNSRRNTGDADDMWVIKAFDDRHDALEFEHIISSKYGIPMMPFTVAINGRGLNQESINYIFSTLEPLLNDRAAQLLADFGQDIHWPIVDKSTTGKAGRVKRVGVHYRWLARACQVLALSDYVEMPTDNGVRTAVWRTVNATSQNY
jgi:DNA helicase-2/ATP-dependent DNA helicase PcrA